MPPETQAPQAEGEFNHVRRSAPCWPRRDSGRRRGREPPGPPVRGAPACRALSAGGARRAPPALASARAFLLLSFSEGLRQTLSSSRLRYKRPFLRGPP